MFTNDSQNSPLDDALVLAADRLCREAARLEWGHDALAVELPVTRGLDSPPRGLRLMLQHALSPASRLLDSASAPQYRVEWQLVGDPGAYRLMAKMPAVPRSWKLAAVPAFPKLLALLRKACEVPHDDAAVEVLLAFAKGGE